MYGLEFFPDDLIDGKSLFMQMPDPVLTKTHDAT